MRSARLALALGGAIATIAVASAARADAPAATEAPKYPPMTIPYEDGEAIVPGYHVEQRATRTYLLLGGSLFGASYLASLAIGGAVGASKQPDAPRVAPLAIPIAGPFITLTRAGAGIPGGVALALDGIAQTGGAILFVSGLVIPEKVLVFNTIPVAVNVAPTPGGVVFHGTF